METSLRSKPEHTYNFDTGPLWDPNSDRYRSDDTFDLHTRTEMISVSDASESVCTVFILHFSSAEQKTRGCFSAVQITVIKQHLLQLHQTGLTPEQVELVKISPFFCTSLI